MNALFVERMAEGLIPGKLLLKLALLLEGNWVTFEEEDERQWIRFIGTGFVITIRDGAQVNIEQRFPGKAPVLGMVFGYRHIYSRERGRERGLVAMIFDHSRSQDARYIRSASDFEFFRTKHPALRSQISVFERMYRNFLPLLKE